jgi:alkylation response protein AidB-like acyl-CoA dehydrogenase
VLDQIETARSTLDDALEQIASGAAARDSQPLPSFPEAPFSRLEGVGATTFNAAAGERRPPAAAELELVRRVARADGSVGRIFDGHLNAVERVAVQAPPEVREAELAAVASGALRGGVWGGDPVPGEGDPATVVSGLDGPVLRGVKTFCSGAGGLHRALVIARDHAGGKPLSVWIDLTDTDTVEIDERWYRAHGLRASVSHRVVFHDAPVLAQLGGPGAIAAQPWFARDALRTAASWVGMADTAVDSALAALAARPARGDVEALGAGRILAASHTLDVWLSAAAEAMDRAGDDLPAVALHARAAVYETCRTLLDEAARACGSRPFATAGSLDRARRDLELFLLQHRLDPLLARAGAAELDRLADHT